MIITLFSLRISSHLEDKSLSSFNYGCLLFIRTRLVWHSKCFSASFLLFLDALHSILLAPLLISPVFLALSAAALLFFSSHLSFQEFLSYLFALAAGRLTLYFLLLDLMDIE